jgi:outer membrane lipoprotein-sorting protein
MTSTTKTKVYLLVLVGLFVQLDASGQVRTSSRKPDPKAIIARMTQRYGTVSSYEDIGVVVNTTERDSGGSIEKKPFKIFFTRPNLFRFEWIDYFPWKEGRLYMIWSNGKGAFSYSQPDEYEQEESLEMAIAGATGISSGAAYTIPTMLTDDASGFTFSDLEKLTLVNEEIFEGELCYHLRGFDRSKELHDLWISKKNYLLRKSRGESKHEDETWISEEIHRNIKIDQPISGNIFDYKPPIALTSPEEQQRRDNLLSSQETLTWTEFVSNEGRFSVLLPAKPTTHTLTFETGQGQVVHHGFIASGGGIMCVLDYADLPKTATLPGSEKAIFDQARDSLLKEAQVSLASETTIALEGHPGREMSAHLLGSEIKARFYLVNGRLYQLVITQFRLSLDKPVDSIDKFFGSFKIIAESRPIAVARSLVKD